MKVIGIVLFVLAGVMLLVTIFGAVNQARGGTAMDLVRCLRARFGIYFAPGVTWAALGVCCLGLDKLLKKKGQPAASAGDSAAARAKAPARPTPAETAPTITPAKAEPTITPPTPAPPIRPATVKPRPDEQDTPGR